MSNRNVSDPRRATPIAWLPLACVLVVALVVRLWVIGRDALWLDEGYSWWDAQQPFAALFSRVPECDPHPPLYFAVLHRWIDAFGDGTVAMRSLSTVLGLCTVVVVYLAGRELDRARTGGVDRPFGIAALAALLFALTPFQIYFSIEARPYALLCLGAALMTLGMMKILAVELPGLRPPSRGRMAHWIDGVPRSAWYLLVVGGTLMVWTNNTAVLFVGAISCAFVGLWVFDRDSHGSILPIVLAGVLIAIFWSPDWPLLISQSREVTEDFWIAPPTFRNLTFELHNLIGLDILRLTWWMAFAAGCGLLAIGRRIGRRWALVLAALIVLPVAFNVIISALIKPILISRAMIGIAPAFAIAMAGTTVLLSNRLLRIAIGVGLVIVFGYSTSRFLLVDHVKEPWKPLVARLATLPAQTPILVVPNEMALPLGHQAHVAGVPLAIVGVPADFPAIGMAARYPSGKCAPSVVKQDLRPQMEALRERPEVVLLTRLNNTYDPDQAVAAALRGAGFRLAGDEVFQPGDLRLMRFVRQTY